MRTVILLVPIVQTLLFGYAVTTDVKNIGTVIVDGDKSSLSRMFVNAFMSTDHFRLSGTGDNYDYAVQMIDCGEADFGLIISPEFCKNVVENYNISVQIIVDGSNAMKAGTALGYASDIISKFNKETVFRGLDLNSVDIKQVKLSERILFNPNLHSKNFYLPGVIAAMVMIITLMLSGMSVVREKEMGTIEQILVTPISKFEFIVGKTVPFAIIGMVDVILVTTVAIFWFKIPFRGNLLLLFFANSLFLLSTLGVGLLISTLCSTQQQAMLSTFFFVIPALLLSGFIFPVSNMPVWIQYLTYINPLKYMIVILRGLFLKGSSLQVLWQNFASLTVLGLIFLYGAILRFRKTI